MTVRLAAVILTYNEARHVADCIASVRWADRVVVFDSFSQDETVALAKAVGAEVAQEKFQNYAQQRNAALDALHTDWVFFVDADERGTPELGAEIRRVIAERPEMGWYVPRHNYIFGKLTLGAGWYPDYQLRLFRRKSAHYDQQRPVHELVQINGEVGHLKEPLIHYNYVDWEQFHAKQQHYVRYEAKILAERGIQPRPHNFVLQPLREFVRRALKLQGWRDGLPGLRHLHRVPPKVGKPERHPKHTPIGDGIGAHPPIPGRGERSCAGDDRTRLIEELIRSVTL